MDLHQLETRLAALENKVRRLRMLAVAAVGTALAVFVLGGAPPRNKIVEASTFVLIDDNGKERAQLGVSTDGAAALLLRHGDGFTDARLGLLPNGTMALSMRNPRKSASLEVSADGTAALRINEKYAKSAVEVGLDSGGKPRMVLVDTDGKAVFKAP